MIALHICSLAAAIINIVGKASATPLLSEEATQVVEVAQLVSVFIVSCYMMGQAIFYIIRFAQMKAASLRLRGVSSPYKQPFFCSIIVWLSTILALNVLLVIFIVILEVLQNFEVLTDPDLTFQGIHTTFFNLVIFLDCFTMLVLFYFVSKNAKKQRSKSAACVSE